jgi:hypothetical protein|nr:MAG TPA: hypothetical protein [Caudoviricetes sp.]
MIRLGTPSNTDKYVCLEGQEAFLAHQAGNIPEWKDEDGSLWFKRTKKLLKFCAENSIEL